MWTPDRLEKLRKLWAEGLTGKEIAQRLGQGLTRSAVLGKINRLGLKRPDELNKRPIPPKRVRKPNKGQIKPTPIPDIALPVQVRVVAVGDVETLDPVNTPFPSFEDIEARLKGEVELVHFLQLKEGQCKWPLWGDREKIGFCCGKSTAKGQPYCPDHQSRMATRNSFYRLTNKTW